MAEKIGEAYVEVHAKTDSMESGLRSSLGKISGLVAGAFAAEKVASFTGSMISAASDLSETTSQVAVIFGDSEGQIRQWASTAATSIGQSSNTAMQAASTFATFGKSAGLAGGDLAGFATDLVGLSSDLASFKNTTPEEAIEAIGAALRGEAEPIRKYGVLLDDATLRNRAFAMGLIENTKDALTPANKVLAAQAEIIAQTGDAQGDFARTSDGLANSQRIMAARFEEAKAKMGQAFLPIAQATVGFLSDKMIPVFEEVGGAFQAFFAAFKAGDGDVTSSGFPGFMEKVGYYARLFVDQVVEWWPTIREVMVSVFDAVTTAAGWFIENVVPRIVAAVEWVVTWVRENWPEIQRVIGEVVDWIGTNVVPVVEAVVGYLVGKFNEVVSWTREHWPEISATVEAVIDRIRTVIEVVTEIVRTIWQNWGDNIVNVATTIFGYVKTTVENAINFVKSVIETVMAVIRGDWSGAWDGIKGILGAVWDQIRNVVSTAGALLKEGLSALWTGIKLGADAAWEGVKSLVSKAVDSLVDYVKALPGKLLDWVGDLGDAALKLGEAIVKKIGEGLKGLGEAIASPFKAAWNAVAGWWNSNVGNLSFEIPGWVPGIGGKGFDMPNLPKFHTGGVMPGLSTEEGLAVLKGGETVFTPDQMRALAEYGFGQSSGPAVHVEHAHFETELDIEAFGRMAGWVLAGQGVGL